MGWCQPGTARRERHGVERHEPELSGKRLELLKETLPHVSRVAVLWNAGNLNRPDQLPEIEGTARVAGIQLSPWKYGILTSWTASLLP